MIKRLLWALTAMLLAVSAYGFLAARLRLSEIDTKKEFQIVVTDTDADERYYWLTVEGCSADHSDAGVTCNLGWYGRSDREWPRESKQVPVPFRDAPRGSLLLFNARITDKQGKPVASSMFLTSRSF